jgi:hypothetical protein
VQGKAKSELIAPSTAANRGYGSKDTSETISSSTESQVDTIKFKHGVPSVVEPLPPPELHWKLSHEEIESQRALQRLDEIKR